LSQCDTLGNCMLQEFDAEYRLRRSIDPLGGVNERQYNGQGQRTRHIDPLGESIQTSFDARGKLERLIDPLGGEIAYQFGDFGQLLAETERDSQRRDFNYDAGVRLQSETWVGAGDSGISWSHDAGNLIDAPGWSDADLSLSYWPNGKIRRITQTSATAPNWWIEYSYDANNNVTRWRILSAARPQPHSATRQGRAAIICSATASTATSTTRVVR